MSDRSKTRLGTAGENAVMKYFVQDGHVVLPNVDSFDDQKDMIIDGKTVEVKTQVPFVEQNSFSIRPGQMKKCKSVDYVIFVSVPNVNKNHWSAGKIFRIDFDKVRSNRFRTSSGLRLLIPIDQPGMECIYTLTEEDQKLLESYSVSEWNNG